MTPGPPKALMDKRDAYQQYFLDMIEAGILRGHFTSGNPRVATYAILLQGTGVSAWFKVSGAMTIDEVADHHVDLVLGSLYTDPELIASALAAVRAT
jgi:hypothetical protein